MAERHTRDLIVVHGTDRTQCGFQRFVLPTILHATSLTSNVHVEMRCHPVTDPNELKRLVSVVIVRPADPNWKGTIAYYTQKRQFYGFKVLTDFDDPLWALYPHCRQLLEETVRGFDCAVLSTRALKENFLKYYPNTKAIVVPNGIADFLYGGRTRDDGEGPKERPVVLYGGAGGHEKDFDGPWGQWLRQKVDADEIDFHCFAKAVAPLDDKRFADKITVHGGVTPPQWGDAVSSIRPDFYIAPLEDCLVNRTKSDLKYKEACQLGAVFLGTGGSWTPYRAAPKSQLVDNSDSVETLESKFRELCEPENFSKAVRAQRDQLTEKHARMTDPVFIGKWLIAYGNCKEA